MMAFRSRKRKAGAAHETQAAKPPADAAATTPTGSPCKHPVAAFANTVYVDPVIKVRRRARVPFSNCARDRKRASRAPYTDVRPDSIPAAADRETPRNTEQPSHRQGVYRYVDKKTFLNWGLTSDWLVEGPRARRASTGAASTSPPTPQKREGRGAANNAADPSVSEAPEAPDEDPNASSEGYGEMTEGSIERLLAFLKTLGSHPEVERLAAGAGAGARRRLRVAAAARRPPPPPRRGTSAPPTRT